MEQKDEIEAVFDKTSYDWKNRLASPIKTKHLFKVETCLCPFGEKLDTVFGLMSGSLQEV